MPKRKAASQTIPCPETYLEAFKDLFQKAAKEAVAGDGIPALKKQVSRPGAWRRGGAPALAAAEHARSRPPSMPALAAGRRHPHA